MTERILRTGVAAELQQRLPAGRVLSGEDYRQSCEIWNGAVTSEPALIVRPKNADEVAIAVRAAVSHGMPLSVRAGGHDWAGRALCDQGLVIDLTAMSSVEIDPENRIARVQGGATAGTVAKAALAHGLSAATGTVSHVGMTGLTLGGGYGPLNGRFGLALDNLLGAEVVLADGRRVATDGSNEAELFWALRGGGGNFGVVTEMEVRLHPVAEVLAGMILFPWSQAADIWAQLDVLLANGPDELTVLSGLLMGADAKPAMLLSPVWSGDPTEGKRFIDHLRSMGTPLLAEVGQQSYFGVFGVLDPHVVNGRHCTLRTRTVARLSSGVIAALIEAGDNLTSPFSGVFMHHFHGASTRVPLGETAFGLRDPHFVAEIYAAWEPGESTSPHHAWADRVSLDLVPHALPGGYPNVLIPADKDQISDAFGPNADRLLVAKDTYDPRGVFTAIPLPTSIPLDCKEIGAMSESTTTQLNREVINRFYAAGLAGDLDTVFGILDPEFVINEPPFLAYGGEYHGVEGFRHLLMQVAEFLDLPAVVVQSVTVDGDRAVVVLQTRTIADRQPVIICEEWRLREGRLLSARIWWFDPMPALAR